MTECLSCKSISGEERISPGEIIFEGEFWQVEHAYPTAILGWLVIVLKKHKAALHELSYEENIELAVIQHDVVMWLRRELNCEKEYVVCFAEGSGFQHIHYHIIPKPEGMYAQYKGVHVFQLIGHHSYEPVAKAEVIDFCKKFAKNMIV